MKVKRKTFAKNEAYQKGKEDFYKGKVSNPYRPHTYYWKEWHRGFNRAYFKNLAIYA